MATEQATESLKNVNSNAFFGKVPGAEQCALCLWRYGKSYPFIATIAPSLVVKRDAEILSWPISTPSVTAAPPWMD